ncbi:MAG TPA: hypothetical protein VM324_07290 [Egibacteraceae bacterium]|jgi:hypothetical protein|nr:hypothetical protein [Egibacteraceae bacterium]
MATLEVLDHGELIVVFFDDLVKYHGRSSIAGLAHGFKVMERAFPLLADEPPERYAITVDSAFAGAGTRDAFEMVTRAVTGNRYRLAPEIAPRDAPPGPEGPFFFRLAYRGRSADLTLRPGHMSDDFLELAGRGPATPAEAETLVRAKEDMARRLLALPAEEVYDARVGSGGDQGAA